MYVPHIRMSMLGRLGGAAGAEQFSMNINISLPGPLFFLDGFLIDDLTLWSDMADDCAAFFGDPALGIHSDAVLTMVKFAPIGVDGKYTGAPIEKVRVQPGGVGPGTANPAPRPDNSQALALTLHTNGDLGRVKGRIYAPLPAFEAQTDGRYGAATADQAEGAFRTFINNINNEAGLDVANTKVVVASQGRHNKNGTVRVPPTNHLVTAVSVGRVPDTQRRRRNKLSEGRTVAAL